MKILQCIPTMMGGGAERQLAYLARALVDHGHEVHVAMLRAGAVSGLLDCAGATVHTLPEHPGWDPRGLRDLVALIHHTRVDLVQTWLARMDVWGGLAAHLTRRPWIHSERSLGVNDQTLRGRMVEQLLRTATAVVANSATGTARLKARRGAHGRVYMVPNGLPAEAIAATAPASRAALGVPEGAPVVLYVGRFSPEKNVMGLAEIIGRLLVRRRDVTAVLCGDGPDLPAFRAAIEARGLSARCLTLGYRQDVWAVMKAATVFVSPSLLEGRPNAVHEAMLCGCPMVLSDIPQHREFVPADAALFFAPSDPVAGARSLESALDDPTGTTAMGQRARAAADGLTIDAMARGYEGIYRELLGAR